DPRYGNDLGIVSGRKDFIGLLEIFVTERLLNDRYSPISQESDYSLASNARQECPVREWSKYDSIFRHENVGRCEFRDIPQHVADNGVVEAAGLRVAERPGVVGIETASLGV